MRMSNTLSYISMVVVMYPGQWRFTSYFALNWQMRPGCASCCRNIAWPRKIPSRLRWMMPSRLITGCWGKDFKPSDIIIAGDFAGGGLALAITLVLRDAGEALPTAVVCISPWTNLNLTGDSYRIKAKTDPILNMKELRHWALCYADEDNLSNPLVSPANADFHDFPPMLIQVGSEEILLDDAVTVAEKAKAAGVDVTLESL